MDRTGRRRRLFTALGAALGVLVMAGGSLLIAGLLGSSPVPLPGLPNNGQAALQRDDGGAAGQSPAPEPLVQEGTARPRPSAAPGTAAPAPAPGTGTPTLAATTDRPGARRSSHAANPKPSRTK